MPTAYFFTADQLGSIREMSDSSAAIRARYDYDPYGRRTKVVGDLEADFGFTGHYLHMTSSLHLAPYRAYDANTARWLNRDPMAEQGGMNLYGYVSSDPVNRSDSLGLAPSFEWDGNGWHVNLSRGRGAPGYTVAIGAGGGLVFGEKTGHPLPAGGAEAHFEANFINNSQNAIKGLDSINSKILATRNAELAARMRDFQAAYVQTTFPDGQPGDLPPRLRGSFPAIAIIGGILLFFDTQAWAQRMISDLWMYSHDCQGKLPNDQAWAMVELLDMRATMNARALFTGDLAMREVLRHSGGCGN